MASAILMPKLGLTMEVGTVIAWRKHEGETVRAGEVLCEVETDKITTDVESPQDGTVLKILVPEGSEVKVQTVLAVVGQPGEDIGELIAPPAAATAEKPTVEKPAGEEPATEHTIADRGGPRITPRARKLMTENGLSPDSLSSLGKERITEADVQELIDRRTKSDMGTARLRPMSRIERVVAARMTESFRDIPQFSVRSVVEMDHLLSLFPAGQFGINELVLRAVALALSRSPEVQYQYRAEGLFTPVEINLGFAVALGRDLVVPVIRNADRKRIGELAREASALVEKAKAHALRPDDMSGGTFTVSNLGMFGISSFTPIVNPGEGAILGVGAAQAAPWVRDGKLVVAQAVELTLVCDHRSVNGATGAAFCRELKKIVENEEAGSW